MKRRHFLTGSAAGLSAGVLEKRAAAQIAEPEERNDRQQPIKIGFVGLGPYSRAMTYIEAIHDSNPAKTAFQIVAVWGKEDGYINSYRGTEAWKKQQLDNLRSTTSYDRLTNDFGIRHILRHPEEMIDIVDGVFITDPEDSLNLARPFLEAGMPVFVDSPIAWTLHETGEIIRLAKQNRCPLATGSYVPRMNEVRAAASHIDPEKIQHYYCEGATENFVSYMPDILETLLQIVGEKVVGCSTHGMTWPADEAPNSIPPVMVHIEHEKTVEDRDSVIGVVSTRHVDPCRYWIKIHLDNDVVEQCIYETGQQTPELDKNRLQPFFTMIARCFETGVWPENERFILNKAATMLMVHKSGISGGIPVGIDEIEHHALPRYRTETALG